MSAPVRHVFVCTNARPVGGKPSCANRGAGGLLTAFQRELGLHPELAAQVAITPTGCLGPCFEGPVVVVYPDGVWYAGLEAADVSALVSLHLVGGRVLEARRFIWPED